MLFRYISILGMVSLFLVSACQVREDFIRENPNDSDSPYYGLEPPSINVLYPQTGDTIPNIFHVIGNFEDDLPIDQGILEGYASVDDSSTYSLTSGTDWETQWDVSFSGMEFGIHVLSLSATDSRSNEATEEVVFNIGKCGTERTVLTEEASAHRKEVDIVAYENNFIAVWEEQAGTENMDLYIGEIDVENLESHEKLAFHTHSSNQQKPVIAPIDTDDGTYVVLWQDYRDEETTSDIYWDTIEWTNKDSFQADQNAQPFVQADGQQDMIAAASNMLGVGVVWQDTRNDLQKDIYFRLIDSDTMELEDTVGEIRLTSEGSHQSNPRIAAAEDSFLVVYTSANDIYACFIYDDLTTSAHAKITDISTSEPKIQRFADVAAGSTGNFAITWEDETNGGDVYFKIIKSDGTMNEAVQITTMSSAQTKPRIIWTGKVYGIGWLDYRSYTEQVYYRSISASGIISEETLITTGNHDHLNVELAFNDEVMGGVWDTSNIIDDSDIYFNWISQSPSE